MKSGLKITPLHCNTYYHPPLIYRHRRCNIQNSNFVSHEYETVSLTTRGKHALSPHGTNYERQKGERGEDWGSRFLSTLASITLHDVTCQ